MGRAIILMMDSFGIAAPLPKNFHRFSCADVVQWLQAHKRDFEKKEVVECIRIIVENNITGNDLLTLDQSYLIRVFGEIGKFILKSRNAHHRAYSEHSTFYKKV